MLNEQEIDCVNNCLKKIPVKRLNQSLKYCYISLLLEYRTFLPFCMTREKFADDFSVEERQVSNIIKSLDQKHLLKKYRVGNRWFLQLIPPHPYRFLKGEFFQSRIKSIGKSTHHEIILTKIRDVHDYDFTQDCHFISNSTEDAEINKSLDGMESGFDLFFVAEVKVSKKGGKWLDHSTHFTNDWLMREHQQALEAITLESLEEEEKRLEITPPPSTKPETQELAATFSWSY